MKVREAKTALRLGSKKGKKGKAKFLFVVFALLAFFASLLLLKNEPSR